jgi:hypothetical protein
MKNFWGIVKFFLQHSMMDGTIQIELVSRADKGWSTRTKFEAFEDLY